MVRLLLAISTMILMSNNGYATTSIEDCESVIDQKKNTSVVPYGYGGFKKPSHLQSLVGMGFVAHVKVGDLLQTHQGIIVEENVLGFYYFNPEQNGFFQLNGNLGWFEQVTVAEWPGPSLVELIKAYLRSEKHKVDRQEAMQLIYVPESEGGWTVAQLANQLGRAAGRRGHQNLPRIPALSAAVVHWVGLTYALELTNLSEFNPVP